MTQTLDELAERLVKILATHPRIDFEVEQEFFRHIITANYNPSKHRFSTKLPKGRVQQLVQTLRMTPIPDVNTEFEFETQEPPKEKDIVRYEKKLSLRRVLRNDMARYTIPASQQSPILTAYSAFKLTGNLALRVLWDTFASGAGHASAAEGQVRRLPNSIRQAMYDSYRAGNPISVSGRLQIVDHITQIDDNGFVNYHKPFFVITTPILVMNGVVYNHEDYKDRKKLSDRKTIPGFEEWLTIYERAKIPNVFGTQRDLLVRVTKQQYENEVTQYLTAHPQLKKAVEAGNA